MIQFEAVTLNLEVVRKYLAARGWVLLRSDDAKEIWRTSDPEQEHDTALLPLDQRSDYGARVRDLLVTLGRHAGETIEEVLIDLSWPDFDKLSVRTRIDDEGGTIDLEDGIDVHSAVRDLVVAAAKAANEPKASYGKRWATSVRDYVDRVRLAPSQPGSFIIRALLPLTPEPATMPLFDSTDRRLVARTLMAATQAATEAATRRAEGASETIFDEAVANGVSANLLDALARIAGPDEANPAAFEVKVEWSYTELDEPIPPIRVEPGLVPILSWGAGYLRGVGQESWLEVTGLVTRLHREAGLGPGTVTVHGFVEGPAWTSSTRSLKMNMDETTYAEATEAHRDGATVHARCDIELGPAGVQVVRVTSFSVEETNEPDGDT